MCAPKIPDPPDPTKTIAAQTTSNKETAIANADLNRIGQNTPYGSLSYDITGTSPNGLPQYTQNVTLSPEQQALYNKYTQGQNTLADTALGGLGNVQSNFSKPFSYGGPGPTGSVASPTTGTTGVASPTTGTTTNIANAGPDAIKQAQDAAYRGQTQYLDPQFADAQSALDSKLANQGLQVGGEAYDKAQRQLGLQKRGAYQSAQDSAVGAGNQEQNVLFGQGLNQANLQNSVNQQQYGQNLGSAALQNSVNQQQYGQNLNNANLQNQGSTLGLQQAAYLYNQPLSNYNSLITGSQPTNPTFSNVPGVNQANTDVAGIANQGYQNQLSRYNSSQQGINNLFSLGGSLGSAAILASDRRLKRNIRRVGTTAGGIPTYLFRYNDDDEQTYFGVMADEVHHIPGAAVLMPNGYWGVNYSVVP